MTTDDDEDEDVLATPLWESREFQAVGGVMYAEGAVVRSWNLPTNNLLVPLNATAKRIARYAGRVRHHPLKPKTASTMHGIFLPAVLRFGDDNVTGCLVDGGVHDEMPHFAHSGVVLTWPGTYIVKYDKPTNEAAERLLEYWREFHDRPELDPYPSCWNVLTDALWLPALRKLERPESETLPAYVGAPRPSTYVASDARSDSPVVPERPPASPVIRTRQIRETRAVQLGQHDPTSRR